MSEKSQKLKVLLVSPYSDKLVGGIINWTKYIVNYQRQSETDIELTLLNNENATQIVGSASFFKRFFTGMSNYLPIVRQFKEMISLERYDVVHISTSASFGLIRDLMIVNAARKKKIKTVSHMHFGRIPQILQSKGWESMLFKRLAKTVDCMAVMDYYSLKTLKDNGYNNVRLVPNPLSTDVQKVIESTGEVVREQRKIVYAGHVLASKGLRELVSACKDISHIKLELLGKVSEDAFREQLYLLGGKDSKEWLSIPGNKSFKEVIAEMKSCAVFVLPSYSEGFPNVILESMACGCPIIATPVGAIPEMLDINGDKPCGICVPKQNVEELRNAISYLLDNPQEAKRLGEDALKRVHEQYAISKVWNQLTDIWKNA